MSNECANETSHQILKSYHSSLEMNQPLRKTPALRGPVEHWTQTGADPWTEGWDFVIHLIHKGRKIQLTTTFPLYVTCLPVSGSPVALLTVEAVFARTDWDRIWILHLADT